MKLRLLFTLLCIGITSVMAQTGPYVKLKFKANPQQWMRIVSGGIDPEGISKQGEYYIAELSQEELTLVRTHATSTEVLNNDISNYYAERAGTDKQNLDKNQGAVPPGFKYGTLGSYLNYSEIVSMLDSMQRRYPHLISVKKSIGNTLENNPMYMVKISDNPEKDEPQEKQVLYDAMHHAREPQGMMQLMYFMWYMMDRYEKNDPIARYIIKNRELYFIPIVNPDGYLYNQSISPDGGGMWRKNRSNNLDATRGVDLNRNYGYDWGYDDLGSSPFGQSNTFRGIGAFSEPETQNMCDFVNTKKFKSNLSYHTYGGYLIYPFGAKQNYYTPDSNLFRLYADSLTKDNGYFSGTVFETLSYFANGGSCDWMYGDSSHPKIISFTPEVGLADDGFWPAPSRIVPLCEENIAPNLFLAKYGANGLDVITKDTTIASSNNLSIEVNYFSAGLAMSNVKSYLDFFNNPMVVGTTDTFSIFGLNSFESSSNTFDVSFNTSTSNTEIPYRIVTSIGNEIQYDTALLIINKSLGVISPESSNPKIKIYPNPSTQTLHIDYTLKPNTIISIYSIEGKLISKHQQNNIDVSGLISGTYFISIREAEKNIAIETFQKK